MKQLISIKILLTILFSSSFAVQSVTAQTYSLNNNTSFLEVHGTSSLHDWHVDAEEQSGKIVITNTENLEIKSLSFSVKAESLKSGKSSMDNNTYKALNTDDYKTIDFKLNSVKQVEKVKENSFKVSVLGNMTISGVTKTITLELTIKLDGTKVLIEGEKSILMTDYGIDPPKALLGTIKTGNKINIIFKSVFEI